MLDAFRELQGRAAAAHREWERPPRPRINVAIDTSSLAAHADRTREALRAAIEERSAVVDFGQTAGYGLQWLQPLADIT